MVVLTHWFVIFFSFCKKLGLCLAICICRTAFSWWEANSDALSRRVAQGMAHQDAEPAGAPWRIGRVRRRQPAADRRPLPVWADEGGEACHGSPHHSQRAVFLAGLLLVLWCGLGCDGSVALRKTLDVSDYLPGSCSAWELLCFSILNNAPRCSVQWYALLDDREDS